MIMHEKIGTCIYKSERCGGLMILPLFEVTTGSSLVVVVTGKSDVAGVAAGQM